MRLPQNPPAKNQIKKVFAKVLFGFRKRKNFICFARAIVTRCHSVNWIHPEMCGCFLSFNLDRKGTGERVSETGVVLAFALFKTWTIYYCQSLIGIRKQFLCILGYCFLLWLCDCGWVFVWILYTLCVAVAIANARNVHATSMLRMCTHPSRQKVQHQRDNGSIWACIHSTLLWTVTMLRVKRYILLFPKTGTFFSFDIEQNRSANILDICEKLLDLD